MRPKIANCAVPHLLEKANCAAECGKNCQIVRRNCGKYSLGKSAVIVRHFQLLFGSKWQQLCINNVVDRPDQTLEHQKQQKHHPGTWPRVSEFL